MRRKPLLVALAIVLASSAFLFGRESRVLRADGPARPDGRPAVADAAVADVATAERTPAASRRAGLMEDAVRAPASTPLPSPSPAFADDYEMLKARAEAGESRATCRLARGLERCAANEHLGRQLKHVEASLREPAAARPPGLSAEAWEEQRIETAAQLMRRIERDAAFCEGMPAAALHDAASWLLRAADAGYERFVMSALLSSTRGLPLDAQRRLLDRYGQVAPRIIERGLAMGQLEVVQALIMATADPNGTIANNLSGLVQPDPQRAWTYLSMLDSLGIPSTYSHPGMKDQLRESLSDAERTAAEREAAAMKPRFEARVRRMSQAHGALGSPAECDEPPGF